MVQDRSPPLIPATRERISEFVVRTSPFGLALGPNLFRPPRLIRA